jgi:hypothetical protein
MKTLEFIKAIKKLEYYPKEDNAIIKIANSQMIPFVYADVATKHRNVLRTDYFPFTELTSEKQAELLDVLIEYARTPIEEREEEKVYRLRYKWLEENCEDRDAYLNFDKYDKTCFLSNDLETTSVTLLGTRAKWEQRTGRTWAQLMNEFDVEEIE